MKSVHIIYGDGYGKTASAMGLAVKAVGAGETVTVVQFLKGTDADYTCLGQFDEINFFTFENSEKTYDQMTEEEREAQRTKTMNSFHYAKKVIDTGSTDVVVLDEVLGMLDYNVISVTEIEELLEINSDVRLIMTGRNCPESIKSKATLVSHVMAD